MTKKIDLVKESNDAEAISNMYNLVNLTVLDKITKSTKITRLLEESYKDAKSNTWLTKVTISIINSILTQNRKVFILNRDFIGRLVDNDTNHYNKVSFNKAKYQLLIEHITKYLCKIEKIKRSNYYVMMCILTHTELLKLIKGNIIEQEKEVRLFITGEIVDETPTPDQKQETQELTNTDQPQTKPVSRFRRNTK